MLNSTPKHKTAPRSVIGHDTHNNASDTDDIASRSSSQVVAPNRVRSFVYIIETIAYQTEGRVQQFRMDKITFKRICRHTVQQATSREATLFRTIPT